MLTIPKRPTIKEVQMLYKEACSIHEVIEYFVSLSKKVDKDIQAVLRYPAEVTTQEIKKAETLVEEYKQNHGEEWFHQLIEDYPLFGIPYNLKDNILVTGTETTSASKIMQGHISSYDATVYRRLKEAGAILISQSNLDEWAVGSSTENSAFQTTKNPFDTSRVPGGSSGGPAAVVGSGQAVFSLGSDTGGSIRVPAAFCDVVGVKTTYGAISRYGVMPLSSSLDQVGAFTNSVEDNALVTNILMGEDKDDQTTVDTEDLKINLLDVDSGSKLKIGLPKEYFVEGIDPQIGKAIKGLADKLAEQGHTIQEVSLPRTKFGLAVYYTTMTVETASNLQRYEGIRYGQVQPGEMFWSTRNKHLGDEPKRRIMLGTFASSSGYYDAYYNTAMKVREKMKQDFDKVFHEVDILLAPTTPEFPFKIGEKTSDPIKMYLSDALVYGANLAKLPAISIPIGFFEVEGKQLPTGCQLIGPEFGDDALYSLGVKIEELVDKKYLDR